MNESVGVQNSNKSFREKTRAAFVGVVGTMIGFGAWNDTKDLSINLYEGALAHFTHKHEFNHLNQLHIGNYLPYAETIFGTPLMVKDSQQDPAIQFRYYPKDKYLLILMTKQNRIEGYLVQSNEIADDFKLTGPFNPQLPFLDKALGEQPFSSFEFQDNGFQFDSHNLTYFMEKRALGAQGLDLNLYLGVSDYPQSNQNLLSSIGALDKAVMLDEETETLATINTLRADFSPNFYGLSKLSDQVVAESLLTKYEFNTYL
ncbi:ETEC_3214 domain-containing protein [Ferrimonas lipolytica]|uniref:Uncharacterized protein n=1 Tax=Ferrimonas lipolytica TaxID=2724191 RepID=A0A6H1UHS4_9GAMM|nr:ETEC_3214 domain-containing protein [Ferrimonas lipolytica]QIZ78378.1 hypothetical protein HER31_16600 [Ferrimonas lipolytica]